MRNVVWEPTPAILEAANLTRLAHRLGCARYHELHRVSVEEPDRFWPALVDDLALTFTRRWTSVLDTSDGIEWARWFVGGQINVASSCVHKWDELPGEAAVFLGEDGSRSALTWPELSCRVCPPFAAFPRPLLLTPAGYPWRAAPVD